MERRVLLMQLQNIYALEMARWILDTRRETLQLQLKQAGKPLRLREDRADSSRRDALRYLASAAVGLAAAGILHRIGSGMPGRSFGIFLVEQFLPLLLGLAGVLMLLLGLYRLGFFAAKRRSVRRDNRQRQKQQLRQKQGQRELKAQLAFYDTQMQTLGELLKRCYALCPVPEQYRNGQSLCYIYEQMCQREDSLEQVLSHERFHNGIQAMEKQFFAEAQEKAEQLFKDRIRLAEAAQVQAYLYQVGAEPELIACYRSCGAFFCKGSYLLQLPESLRRS